ncbi:MAG: hypothetical protein KDI01_04350 [Halioglobus sp.]|nr:hypothetical protein [Halioglobus sp.]
MDDKPYKKPEHVRDSVWRQHLDWMDVVDKQLQENRERLRKGSAMASTRSRPENKTSGHT